jgi:hypothetical protein
MRAHIAGKAKGRYICPVNAGVFTHGLHYSVQLTEPMRLVFIPGWDYDIEADHEAVAGRPLPTTRQVRRKRGTPTSSEQHDLDRAGSRVLGPGCVVSRPFKQP